MKNILPILLLSLSAQAQTYHYSPSTGSWTEDTLPTWTKPREAIHHQLSVNAGVNYSSFIGPGYYGHPNVGAAIGVSDQITIGKWLFMPELSYQHKGVFNKNESRNFNVYSAQVSPFIGYQIHSVTLMAGPYYERVLFASNTAFTGDNFSWSGSWPFWRRNQVGITSAIRVDLNGSMLQLEYQYGLTQVRNEINGYDGKPDRTLWKNHNSVVGVRWVVQLKTFGE